MRQVPKKTLHFLYATLILFLLFNKLHPDCSKLFNNYYLTHGQHYQYGAIQLLNLHGSFCDMGREYGYLEQHKLKVFYWELYHLLIEKKRYPYQTLLHLANKIYLHYPQHYKNLLQGMAQTSGLSLQQHIFINAFEYILYYKNFQQPGCAGIAVWKEYTTHHELIFGRNYDYFSGYPQFKQFLSIAVFHPKQQYNVVAMLTFLGTLNATTNMNQYGLFSELNNGYPSGRLLPGGGINNLQRAVTPIDLLSLMFKAKSLLQLNTDIHHYHSSSDFIINFADNTHAESYEWTTHRLVLVHSNDQSSGLLVSTNHFVDLSWHLPLNKENIWFTLRRRKNLIKLANQYYFKHIPISHDIMQKILQRRLINGGATDIKTVYQVIAIPEKRILWVKIIGLNNDWLKINLVPYFRN